MFTIVYNRHNSWDPGSFEGIYIYIYEYINPEKFCYSASALSLRSRLPGCPLGLAAACGKMPLERKWQRRKVGYKNRILSGTNISFADVVGERKNSL